MSDETRAIEFTRERDGSLPIETAVFQALGAASMCWADTPTGIFDSTRAKAIGDALLEVITERPEPEPMADAKHWRELVEARATIARVLTTVETWEEELTYGHAQVDEYARGYCATMREALVKR